MSDTPGMPMDKLIGAYVRIRAKIQERTREFETEIAALTEKKNMVAEAMRDQMKAAGVTSMKVDGLGTAYMQTKTRFYPQDWGALKEYIFANGPSALDLVEKRIAQKNFEQWVSEHPDSFPPGVASDSSLEVVVRKN